VYIKLKMGKDSDNSEENTEDQENAPSEEVKEEKTEEVETEKSEEVKDEPKEEKKEDVEKLRKVIKVDDKKEEKKENPDNKEEEIEIDSSREGLEQKRAILQSIKDFDFQIKKNQEEITTLNSKLDSVSKDLDDLVSLYEIVSEQMNPFVGLSKVTKKRIDALENFTREVEELKNRMGDLESFAEKTGGDLISIRRNKSEELDNIEDNKEDENMDIESEDSEEKESEKTDEEITEHEPETLTPEINVEQKEQEREINNNITISKTYPVEQSSENFEDDLDYIIEQSLMAIAQDLRIDNIIDNFIESLKTNDNY